MDVNEMTIDQVEKRMAEIETELGSEDADISALNAEVDALIARKADLVNAAAEKRSLLDKVATMNTPTVASKPTEERKTMTNAEVRASKEYIDAYVNYIKKDDDRECRALLTEIVSGQVPVPTYVEDRVRTAWQKNGLMNLVRKTYVKGILKVAFERSATGAVIHTEGSTAPSEETLTLGVVTLTPASIKKWITISDEVMDLKGEAFLDYIYDEITYQIVKKAQTELIAKVTALTASATASAPAVGVTAGSPSVGIVAECLGKLSDEAANPVIVMNKASWSAFKAAQYAANYAIDPFEGLPVHFDNSMPAYTSSTATTVTWMIVGDFGQGAQANFPNGAEVTLKFDDTSLAEADLVKIVGREYVGLGIVADHAFCKVTNQ